jgi:hypothetical protein
MSKNNPKHRPLLFYCGALIQGSIVGILLAIAIFELTTLSASTEIFRYQGF